MYSNDFFSHFQAILYQTKGFNCQCKRCQDPEELGSPLGGMRCKIKTCTGYAYPSNPLDKESDLVCNVCQNVISCDMAKMMQDTAMNSVNGKVLHPSETLDIMTNLERFLPASNHIIIDLKLKLIDQVLEDPTFREEYEATAINYCIEMLNLARNIAPGTSKLRGK